MDVINLNLFFWLFCLALVGFGLLVSLLHFSRNRSESSDEREFLNVRGSEAEVIIVGSGILGSALAAVLARDGRRVVVIERDLKEPDRIVGELLQPGGCRALKLLNLQDCLEGLDGQRIEGYILHYICQGNVIEIPFPADHHGIQEGKAFHHGRFVMALRKAAMAEPNVRYIEGTVTKLVEENDVVVGVSYKTKDNNEMQTLCAPLTVVADGCFSRLRKQLVKASPEIKSYFVGFLIEKCPQAETCYAEIVVANPCLVLSYPISSTKRRILVDVRKSSLPKDMRAYLKDEIYPQLPEHLKQPFWNAVESDKLHKMPNNFLPPAPLYRKGALCLGDALNMRHPLTGGGMSVAFHDIVIFRELFRDIPYLGNCDAVLKASHSLYLQRKSNHSFVVNVLSMALYELLTANDEDIHCVKEACLQYFQLGGECIAGPVALLSILKPRPLLLINHFFAVIFYAVYLIYQREPLWAVHRSSYCAIRILFKAFKILFPLIWSEVKTIVTY